MRASHLLHLGCIASLATLSGCASVVVPGAAVVPEPPSLTTGADLLDAMHKRWSGKWFSTLTLRQNITIVGATGREIKQQWVEYLTVPGKLRIDYLPLSQRSGVLYTSGRVHAFVNGKSADVQRGWNPRNILVADVYGQPVDSTIRQLDSLGFTLDRARADIWEGRKVWVVGAPSGDSTSSQFWVDADSLLVRRLVQAEKRGTRTVVTDLRFTKYQDVSGYPVAHEVTMYRDGRLALREEFVDVVANRDLLPALFDPAKWSVTQPPRE